MGSAVGNSASFADGLHEVIDLIPELVTPAGCRPIPEGFLRRQPSAADNRCLEPIRDERFHLHGLLYALALPLHVAVDPEPGLASLQRGRIESNRITHAH